MGLAIVTWLLSRYYRAIVACKRRRNDMKEEKKLSVRKEEGIQHTHSVFTLNTRRLQLQLDVGGKSSIPADQPITCNARQFRALCLLAKKPKASSSNDIENGVLCTIQSTMATTQSHEREMQSFASRLHTFQITHQLSKRRASTQSSKKKGAAGSAVEWPHQRPAAEDVFIRQIQIDSHMLMIHSSHAPAFSSARPSTATITSNAFPAPSNSMAGNPKTTH